MRILIALFTFLTTLCPTALLSQETEENYSILSAFIESTQEFNAFGKQLENAATGWLLSNHPEYDDFHLALLHVNQADTLDINKVQYCSFAVSQKDAEPFVLLCIVKPEMPFSTGFQRNNISAKQINQSKWKEYLFAYLNAAIDSTLSHPDSIALYTSTSGMRPNHAEKLWNKVRKKHPEYAISGFESIRKLPNQKKYEYLTHIFRIDQIISITKKGIGFKPGKYEKEVIMEVAETTEKQWRSSKASDCRVVHSKYGMSLIYEDTGTLVRIPKYDFEKINAFLLQKPLAH